MCACLWYFWYSWLWIHDCDICDIHVLWYLWHSLYLWYSCVFVAFGIRGCDGRAFMVVMFVVFLTFMVVSFVIGTRGCSIYGIRDMHGCSIGEIHDCCIRDICDCPIHGICDFRDWLWHLYPLLLWHSRHSWLCHLWSSLVDVEFVVFVALLRLGYDWPVMIFVTLLLCVICNSIHDCLWHSWHAYSCSTYMQDGIVLMDNIIDLTTNDDDVINNDDNYTRPKIPLRRKQSSNHRVIDALVYNFILY